jgi:hypothetical protein
MTISHALLLELQNAAQPFLSASQQASNGRRVRLQKAVGAVARANGSPPTPPFVVTHADALSGLRLHVARCVALGVPWTAVVAVVNGPPDRADELYRRSA